MKLSTRGRYGVRLMLDLAQHMGAGPVSLKEIAARQEISEKYLSNLVPSLRNAGLVDSVRGAQGGYVLARDPEEITLKDILLVLEGPMCLVECATRPEVCRRSAECLLREVWTEVGEGMLAALDGFTLAGMAERYCLRQPPPSYYI